MRRVRNAMIGAAAGAFLVELGPSIALGYGASVMGYRIYGHAGLVFGAASWPYLLTLEQSLVIPALESHNFHGIQGVPGARLLGGAIGGILGIVINPDAITANSEDAKNAAMKTANQQIEEIHRAVLHKIE